MPIFIGVGSIDKSEAGEGVMEEVPPPPVVLRLAIRRYGGKLDAF